MEWLNNLLNHFALHPMSILVVLFAMSFTKSTVIISSILPPASVMLLAGITVSQLSLHPGLAWLAVTLGAATGSVLNFHIGQYMGHTRLIARYTTRHATKFLRIQNTLQKNSTVVLFTSRFIAVLRYVVPLTAGILGLSARKIYAICLLSAALWAAAFVGIITGISVF